MLRPFKHESVRDFGKMKQLFFAIAMSLFFAGQAVGKQPNIILVMADDQGWGDVGYNGHPFVQTPELDAMARDGFVFDRFYAAAPVCSPTRQEFSARFTSDRASRIRRVARRGWDSTNGSWGSTSSTTILT